MFLLLIAWSFDAYFTHKQEIFQQLVKGPLFMRSVVRRPKATKDTQQIPSLSNPSHTQKGFVSGCCVTLLEIKVLGKRQGKAICTILFFCSYCRVTQLYTHDIARIGTNYFILRSISSYL